MSSPLTLQVTIDVECDKDPGWRTRDPLTYRGVVEALPKRLLPLLDRLGVHATFLLSPEVLCDSECMDLFCGLQGHELGTHLHGEYMAPELPCKDFGKISTDAMQLEYGVELERSKLETLTRLFEMQCGAKPASFRAGRFGIGPQSGRILQDLGYLCDSSVTPGVLWTTVSGERRPDFRKLDCLPWFVDHGGSLIEPGDSALLELPVTILRGQAADELHWFRPWYEPPDGLLAIVDTLAQASTRGSTLVPLTMMFHNVELVPGASPYPQSEIEVDRYLDDLERTLTHALERGAKSCTMAEFHALAWESRMATEPGPIEWERAPGSRTTLFRMPQTEILDTLDEAQAPAWFAYTVRERADRWDLVEPLRWLADELDPDARVLATGCGAGLNLLWLHEQGLADLHGFDVDPKALDAASSLSRKAGANIRYWQDDGLSPQGLTDKLFDAILALNWTHLLEGFDLSTFLARMAHRLAARGRIVLDVIDKSFELDPRNQWRSGDWELPMAERRPSEYRHRYSRAEVRLAAERLGYEIETVLSRSQIIPKKVYVLRKKDNSDVDPLPLPPMPTTGTRNAPLRPRILTIVDSPGWAHDRKSEALRRELSDEFDIHKCYHAELRPEDLDRADLILVYYWLQLAGSPDIVAAMERNRDKLVLGICSHAELEGEKGSEGVALLQQYGRAIFVHNRLLLEEWRRVFDKPVHYTPNGVDLSFFQPSIQSRRPGPLRVGWAGSLENFGRELRGFDLIVAACADLDGVEFVPAIKEERERSPEEMLAWYQDLDVYVCASRCEGTPNPCLEAAACGLPLVTTPVGNMPEYLVDRVNGFFVERRVESIRAALAELVADPGLRAQMSLANRERILDWSWTHQAERYRDLFRTCLEPESALV